MKLPFSPYRSQKEACVDMQPNAFTLTELLIAMAVLAIILVMLLQVVNGIVSSTRIQTQQMESIASARRALDTISVDLKNSVINENAAILIPNSTNNGTLFNLLTSRRGEAGTTNHRFLAVSYSTDSSNNLLRKYGSVTLEQTDFLNATATAPTNGTDPLASGILAIQVRAIADGTNSYSFRDSPSANWATNAYNSTTANTPPTFNAILTTGPTFASGLTNRTRAIEIWIAAVDDQNYQLLEAVNGLATSQSAMGANPNLWRAELDSANIPAAAKSGIRILNKTIHLQ